MNPLTNLPQILIWELGRTTGMFLAWVQGAQFSGSTVLAKIYLPCKIDQERVNSGRNKHGQHWVSKLLCLYYIVAKGPVKKILKNNFELFRTHECPSMSVPRPPMSVHKKIRPNRSSRLAAIRNIYIN